MTPSSRTGVTHHVRVVHTGRNPTPEPSLSQRDHAPRCPAPTDLPTPRARRARRARRAGDVQGRRPGRVAHTRGGRRPARRASSGAPGQLGGARRVPTRRPAGSHRPPLLVRVRRRERPVLGADPHRREGSCARSASRSAGTSTPASAPARWSRSASTSRAASCTCTTEPWAAQARAPCRPSPEANRCAPSSAPDLRLSQAVAGARWPSPPPRTSRPARAARAGPGAGRPGAAARARGRALGRPRAPHRAVRRGPPGRSAGPPRRRPHGR